MCSEINNTFRDVLRDVISTSKGFGTVPRNAVVVALGVSLGTAFGNALGNAECASE